MENDKVPEAFGRRHRKRGEICGAQREHDVEELQRQVGVQGYLTCNKMLVSRQEEGRSNRLPYGASCAPRARQASTLFVVATRNCSAQRHVMNQHFNPISGPNFL
jgi:hypothetical protein